MSEAQLKKAAELVEQLYDVKEAPDQAYERIVWRTAAAYSLGARDALRRVKESLKNDHSHLYVTGSLAPKKPTMRGKR